FRRRQILIGFGLTVMVWLAAVVVSPRHERVRQTLPDSLSDIEFWNLIIEFSEPGGYFRSDNFVSNESAFQRVIPALKKRIEPGGVYLGVGPDQNFTYVAAFGPKLAFIVDIRRQNMLLHLMYKALFELSSNRTEFLSKLFSRPISSQLSQTVTVDRLFEIIGNVSPNTDLAKENLDAILQQLREQHHFDLSESDLRTIE